jgi:hypothetical protein
VESLELKVLFIFFGYASGCQGGEFLFYDFSYEPTVKGKTPLIYSKGGGYGPDFRDLRE